MLIKLEFKFSLQAFNYGHPEVMLYLIIKLLIKDPFINMKDKKDNKDTLFDSIIFRRRLTHDELSIIINAERELIDTHYSRIILNDPSVPFYLRKTKNRYINNYRVPELLIRVNNIILKSFAFNIIDLASEVKSIIEEKSTLFENTKANFIEQIRLNNIKETKDILFLIYASTYLGFDDSILNEFIIAYGRNEGEALIKAKAPYIYADKNRNIYWPIIDSSCIKNRPEEDKYLGTYLGEIKDNQLITSNKSWYSEDETKETDDEDDETKDDLDEDED